MRNLPAVLVLTAASLSGQIEWLHPLDAALPTSRDERPIILYFTFDT